MWSKRNVNRTCAWIPALSCHVMSCHLICLWLGGCSWSCVLSVILHFSTDGFSESWLGQNEFFWRPSSRVCWPSPKNRPHLVRAERKYGEQIGSVCTFTVTARQNVVLYKPLTRCRVVELFWVFGQQRTFDVTPSHTRSTYTEEEKKKDRSMTSHQCDAHSWINARRSSAQHVGVTFSGTCALSVPVLTYEYQRFSIECRELHNLFIRNDIKLIKDWREKKKKVQVRFINVLEILIKGWWDTY